MARKVRTEYGVREKRLRGEADDVSTTTIQARIERLAELRQDYKPRNMLNLDELGSFFKALPQKGVMRKGNKTKCGKKSK